MCSSNDCRCKAVVEPCAVVEVCHCIMICRKLKLLVECLYAVKFVPEIRSAQTQFVCQGGKPEVLPPKLLLVLLVSAYVSNGHHDVFFRNSVENETEPFVEQY